MENNQQAPISGSNLKLTPQKPVKEKRVKEPRKKGDKIFKSIKLEGIWLLLWVNIKKAFTTKSIIAMGIVFLIISFIFTSISLPLIFSSDMFIGKMFSWIGYIFVMFFYVIFLSLLAIILVKTPILEGISQIEIRAGVAIWKSYLIRFTTYLIIAFIYCIINMIIVFSYLPLSAGNPYLRLAFIVSPVIFLFIFAIIWYPLITLIALICSQSMGIFTNIFIGAILAVVPVINGMIPAIQGDDATKNKDITAKVVQLKLAESFYSKTVNDQNVNGIYQDNILEEINKNISKITPNETKCVITTLNLASLISTEGSTTEPACYLISQQSWNITSESYWTEYLERAFYLGEFNVNVTREGQTADQVVNVFDNLYISNILTDLFNTVSENLYSVPVGHPGFDEEGVYYNNSMRSSSSTEFLDISPLVKWLSAQLPEYKNLLTTIEKQYNKYKEIMFGLDQVGQENYSGKTFSYIKNAANPFYRSNYNLELDSPAIRVYKRHPELAIINNLLIQNWMNVYVLNAQTQENVWNMDGWYGEYLGLTNEEMYQKMQERTTSQIVSKYVNPTYQISSMWNGLFGQGMMLDFIAGDTDLEMVPRSLTKGVSNLTDFAQFSSYDYISKSKKLEEIDPNRKLTPMFESATPEFNFGYSAPLVAFIYVLASLGANALVYLAYRKQSRI